MDSSYGSSTEVSDKNFTDPIYIGFSGHVPNSGTAFPTAALFYRNPMNNLFYSFELYRVNNNVFAIAAGMDTSLYQNDRPYGIRIFSIPKHSYDLEADVGGAPNNYIGFRGKTIFGSNTTSTGKYKILENGVPTTLASNVSNYLVKTIDQAYTKQPILVKESGNDSSTKIHYNTDGDDLSEIIISATEAGVADYYECVEAYTNNGSNTFKVDIAAGKWVTAPHQTNDFQNQHLVLEMVLLNVLHFDDRLILGGSINNGNKLYFSQLDDFTYFKEGILDTDAFQTSLISNEMEEIEWFCVKNQLTIGTNNSEWSLDNPNGNITPSAFSLKEDLNMDLIVIMLFY